jgi:hypothetical protein
MTVKQNTYKIGDLKMTDEINTSSDDSTVDTPVTNEEKKFTQTEVNKLVQDRLSRERASSKQIKDELENVKKDYEGRLSSYESVLQDLVTQLKKDIPENYRKLLDSLSLTEQYEFLRKEENKIPLKQVPTSRQNEEQPNKPKRKFSQIF